MHQIVICLGSNLPDRADRVLAAAEYFESLLLPGGHRSQMLVSDDFTGLGAQYANMVLKGLCKSGLEAMIAEAARYETAGGRTPDSKSTGVMPIDVDIVIYDGRILKPQQYTRAYFQALYSKL